MSTTGRRRTAALKLAASAFLGSCVTVLFTLSPLLLFAVSTGLSDITAPIQLVEGFAYCPFALTVGGYLAVCTLVRVVVFTVFNVLLAVVGRYTNAELPSVAVCVVLVAMDRILQKLNPDSPFYFLQKFSPPGLADGTMLFEKYRAVNLFGQCAGYFTFVLTAAVLLIAAGAAVSLAGRFPQLIRSRERKLTFGRGRAFTRISRGYIFRAEVYKQLICEKIGIFIILAAVVIRVVWSVSYF